MRDKVSVDLPDRAAIEARYGYFLPAGKRVKQPKKYTDQPVMLPRGLFNQAIAQTLREQGLTLEKDGIVLCLEKFLAGDKQTFYDHPRDYFKGELKLSDFEGSDLWQRMKALQKEVENLRALPDPAEEQVYRAYDLGVLYDKAAENEQALRYAQSTDRALWLMAQDWAVKQHEVRIDFTGWKLEKVGFDEPDNMLDQQIEMKIGAGGKIIRDTLPLKQYGEFRRWLKDRRLGNLVKYFPAEEIDRAVLINEIERYETKRDELFEKIYRFEELVFIKYEAELKAFHQQLLQTGEEQDASYIGHGAYLKFVMEKGFTDSFDRPNLDQIKYLRNKFEHNEIPHESDPEAPPGESGWLDELVENETSGSSISEKLINLVGNVYDALTSKIQLIA